MRTIIRDLKSPWVWLEALINVSSAIALVWVLRLVLHGNDYAVVVRLLLSIWLAAAYVALLALCRRRIQQVQKRQGRTEN